MIETLEYLAADYKTRRIMEEEYWAALNETIMENEVKALTKAKETLTNVKAILTKEKVALTNEHATITGVQAAMSDVKIAMSDVKEALSIKDTYMNLVDVTVLTKALTNVATTLQQLLEQAGMEIPPALIKNTRIQ